MWWSVLEVAAAVTTLASMAGMAHAPWHHRGPWLAYMGASVMWGTLAAAYGMFPMLLMNFVCFVVAWAGYNKRSPKPPVYAAPWNHSWPKVTQVPAKLGKLLPPAKLELEPLEPDPVKIDFRTDLPHFPWPKPDKYDAGQPTTHNGEVHCCAMSAKFTTGLMGVTTAPLPIGMCDFISDWGPSRSMPKRGFSSKRKVGKTVWLLTRYCGWCGHVTKPYRKKLHDVNEDPDACIPA